jgi:hypothetical protein
VDKIECVFQVDKQWNAIVGGWGKAEQLPQVETACDGLFLLGLPHKWVSMQHNKRWNASPQLHGWDQTMIYDWWHHITEESKTVENSTYETKPSTELFI